MKDKKRLIKGHFFKTPHNKKIPTHTKEFDPFITIKVPELI